MRGFFAGLLLISAFLVGSWRKRPELQEFDLEGFCCGCIAGRLLEFAGTRLARELDQRRGISAWIIQRSRRMTAPQAPLGFRGSPSGMMEARRRSQKGPRLRRLAARKREKIAAGFQPRFSKKATPLAGANFMATEPRVRRKP